MFSGDGRKNFLDYLRNLTPQVLFLSLALLFGLHVDFKTPQLDLEGLINILPFCASVFVFFTATVANMTLYIESVVTSNPALVEEVARIRGSGRGSIAISWYSLKAAWRLNKVVFWRITVAMAVVQITIVGVFIAAIAGALASPFMHK